MAEQSVSTAGARPFNSEYRAPILIWSRVLRWNIGIFAQVSLARIESLFLRISSKRGSNTYCVSAALRTFLRLHALATRGTNGPTEVNTSASVGRAPRKACSMNTRRADVPTLTLTGLTYETTIPN